MRRLALVAALLVPAVASAEDPATVYGEAAVLAGGVAERGGLGYDVALAARYRNVWFRGAWTALQMYTNSPQGHIYEPRLGIEYRTYDNPKAAVFGGLDAGAVDGSDDTEDGLTTINGAFAMPRGGIELGSEHVRVQLTLEIIVGYGRLVNPDASAKTGIERGGNLCLGLIVR